MIKNVILLPCDDVRVEINGKLILIGVYTGNILIVDNPAPEFQVACLFIVELDLENTPKNLEFEIQLPGKNPTRSSATLPDYQKMLPGVKRWSYRHVMPVKDTNVGSGPIQATMVVDGEKVDVMAPVLVFQQSPEAGPPISPST